MQDDPKTKCLEPGGIVFIVSLNSAWADVYTGEPQLVRGGGGGGGGGGGDVAAYLLVVTVY